MRVRANEMSSGTVRVWGSPPEKREDDAMQQNQAALHDLLGRWHRWAQAPARIDDSLMRDFDALICGMEHGQRIALAFKARNFAGGAQVWSSPRVTPEASAEAVAALMGLLEANPTRWFGRRILYLNTRGNRVGESNPMADLTDHEVDLLLQLREEKHPDGRHVFSLQQLADKFEVAKSTVSDICSGRRRGQAPAKVKVI